MQSLFSPFKGKVFICHVSFTGLYPFPSKNKSAYEISANTSAQKEAAITREAIIEPIKYFILFTSSYTILENAHSPLISILMKELKNYSFSHRAASFAQ